MLRRVWPALLCAPLAAYAGDAADWLLRMSQAAKSANYQGVAIYRGDDILETFRVTHRFKDGVERERVQSLTGEPRDILKQDGKTICLLPGARRMTASQPTPQGLFPGLTPEKVQLLSKIYQFDELGTERIAGRTCRGIAITPRDQYRYGYEVWADQDSAVPLKVNLLAHEGVALEQMMFTEVAFPPSIPDAAFAIQGGVAPSQLAQAPAGKPAVTPEPTVAAAAGVENLPPGFHVAAREVRELPDGRTVEHVLLSDGLSAISIFSSHRTVPGKSFQGVSQMGAVNAYGRMAGTVQITVVGEAPQQTVKMVGDGYQPAGTQPAATAEAAPAAAPDAPRDPAGK